MLFVDEQFNYIKHQTFSSMFTHLAANSSQFLYINAAHTFFLYDSNLSVNQSHLSNKVQANDSNTASDLEMSEKYLFVLCNTHKLKIFDLQTFDLVKEIDVNATQMKLVSTDYLALFNPTSRMMYFYSEDGDFALDEEVSLAESIEAGLTLAHDKTRFISFFNHNLIKYFDIN